MANDDLSVDYGAYRSAVAATQPERDLRALAGGFETGEENAQQPPGPQKTLTQVFHDFFTTGFGKKEWQAVPQFGIGLAKGAAAGVAGIPGDLEHTIRQIAGATAKSGIGSEATQTLEPDKATGEAIQAGQTLPTSESLEKRLTEGQDQEIGASVGVPTAQAMLPALNEAHKTVGNAITKALEPFEDAVEASPTLKRLSDLGGDLTTGLPHVVQPGTQAEAITFLKQESGEKHAPVDLAGYLRGEAENPVHVNMDRIGSGDDIRDAIARVSATLKAPETVSHEATVAAADSLGMTPQDFTAGFKGRLPDASQMTALRFMRDDVANQLVNYAKAAVAPGAGPEEMQQAVKAYGMLHSLQFADQTAGTDIARALNARAIMSGTTGAKQAEAIQKIIEEAGGKDQIAQVMGKLAELDDPLKASRYVEGTFQNPQKNGFLFWYRNALLSNPKTIMKKVTTDGIMPLWDSMTRYATAAWSDNVSMTEANQLVVGYYKNFMDAVRAGGIALKKGESQFSRQFSTLDSTDPRVTSAPPTIATDEPTTAWQDYVKNVVTAPTRGIIGVDDAATYWQYNAQRRALIYRDGIQKGLSGQDLETHVGQLLDTTPPEIHKEAVSLAMRNTFKEPLTGVGEAIQSLVDKMNIPIGFTGYEVPFGRMLLPFTKVPLNLASFGYRNSALALAMPSDVVKADLSAGGSQRDIALTKMGIGSAFMGWMTHWATTGGINGRGPTDPQLQLAWRQAGHEPYTVKIGNRSYGLGVEPFGQMMAAAADTVQMMQFAKDEDSEALAAHAVLGTGNALLSRTYMIGVSEIFQALENPDAKGGKWFDNLVAGTLVPQGLSAIHQATDDWVRTHYGLLDGVESRLPFVANKQLPVARTLWGDPIPMKDAWLPGIGSHGGIERMLSPISSTKDISEPIDRWIWDHRQDFPRGTQNKLGISKPGLIQSFSAGPSLSAQVELTPEQHDKLTQLAGNLLKDPKTGLGAKDYLNALVQGNNPDESTQRMWNNAPPAIQTEMVQRTVNKFRSAAKDELRLEDPNLEQAIRAGLQQRVQQLQAQPQGVAQ